MRDEELGDRFHLLMEQLNDVVAEEVAHEALLQALPEVVDQVIQVESVLRRGLVGSGLRICKLLLNIRSVKILTEIPGTFV